MKDITKTYSNGEVTIIWKPNLCIHSRNCFTGLGEVFHPQELPWITPQRSTTQKIIEQVRKCPSGALSYVMNEESQLPEEEQAVETIVEPSANGPLLVHGTISVKATDGSVTRREKVTAFCRCGGSANKPYCDGTHKKNGFLG